MKPLRCIVAVIFALYFFNDIYIFLSNYFQVILNEHNNTVSNYKLDLPILDGFYISHVSLFFSFLFFYFLFKICSYFKIKLIRVYMKKLCRTKLDTHALLFGSMVTFSMFIAILYVYMEVIRQSNSNLRDTNFFTNVIYSIVLGFLCKKIYKLIAERFYK